MQNIHTHNISDNLLHRQDYQLRIRDKYQKRLVADEDFMLMDELLSNDSIVS